VSGISVLPFVLHQRKLKRIVGYHPHGSAFLAAAYKLSRPGTRRRRTS
jgi:hypothetical protein